jgi:hypothetical protein
MDDHGHKRKASFGFNQLLPSKRRLFDQLPGRNNFDTYVEYGQLEEYYIKKFAQDERKITKFINENEQISMQME